MYTESAAWYDRFHAGKDYAAEARFVVEVIRRHRPDARTLLDVACATGRHLDHFAVEFDCQGLDLDGELLELARRRLPDVPFTQADMTAFDLGRRFDAVTCLFSSIGYAGDVTRLRAALGAMAAHLHPGGVLVVEPWLLPEAWVDGTSGVDVAEDGEGATLVRVRTSRRVGEMTELSMHYVATRGGVITTGDECHRLRLFTREEYLDAARAAGLTTAWDPVGPTGRGLLVGVRA
ncbi:MAG TPA: class I SAM-dependent methyltransferase [Streptosporangiaceae bacterium]|jgi:SAM-dependent methyltransferase